MKVLLCMVYSEALDERHEELGICSIAAFLRSKEMDVKLLGQTEHRLLNSIEDILEFNPDIIGFPIYNLSRDAVYNVIKKVKQKLSSVKVVVGGYYPTYFSKKILEENQLIEYVIRGEGELSFYKLIQAIETQKEFDRVPGLSYRDGKEIKENENMDLIDDLNELPFPSRDMLVENKLKIAQVFSSRGCIRRCSFCCSNDFWKGKWRGKDPQIFVDELEMIVKKYNVKKFFIIDNSFEDPGFNLKRLESIAQEIIKRKLKISYHCNFRAELSRKISRHLLELLVESGLCSILYGYEAANEHDLKIYNKYATIEDNVKAIEICKGLPIVIQIGFINFNPYSTFDSLRTNLKFLEQYNHCTLYNIASRVMIFSGASIKERLKKDGLFIDDTPFGYRYVDQRIEWLIGYISSYMQSLNKMGYGPDRFYYYKVNHTNMLSHEKKHFFHEKKYTEYNIISVHEARINKIFYEFGHRNALWFSKLLKLAEEKWNESEAEAIMSEYLNYEYVKHIAAEIDKDIANTYSNLKEICTEYDFLY